MAPWSSTQSWAIASRRTAPVRPGRAAPAAAADRRSCGRSTSRPGVGTPRRATSEELADRGRLADTWRPEGEHVEPRDVDVTARSIASIARSWPTISSTSGTSVGRLEGQIRTRAVPVQLLRPKRPGMTGVSDRAADRRRRRRPDPVGQRTGHRLVPDAPGDSLARIEGCRTGHLTPSRGAERPERVAGAAHLPRPPHANVSDGSGGRRGHRETLDRRRTARETVGRSSRATSTVEGRPTLAISGRSDWTTSGGGPYAWGVGTLRSPCRSQEERSMEYVIATRELAPAVHLLDSRQTGHRPTFRRS